MSTEKSSIAGALRSRISKALDRWAFLDLAPTSTGDQALPGPGADKHRDRRASEIKHSKVLDRWGFSVLARRSTRSSGLLGLSTADRALDPKSDRKRR